MAARLALRELRGGLAGFRIFLACLALGVAAIAAVGMVRAAIERGLTREAAALLGGDAEVEFTYRFATAEERAWMDANALEVSEIVDFRSLLAFAHGGGEPERTLVQVKAIDDLYPLFGALTLVGSGDPDAALAGGDGLPGLLAAPILIDRLGLEAGDIISLGTQDFRLAGAIGWEPDGAGGSFTYGPRVIVRLADLAESGLLTEGSLFDSSYRLRLAPEADLPALEAEARERFADTGLQWRDRRNGTPSIDAFVERLASFLILLGLAGLAVGGVGVSAAVRAYLEGKTETIATLKTLGATGGTIFAIYLMQIGILAAAGIALRPRARRRGAAPRRSGDGGSAADPGGVRHLPEAARRGGALRGVDRADLHNLAAGARPRHPRRGALPRHERAPAPAAAPPLHRDDAGAGRPSGGDRHLALRRARSSRSTPRAG